MLGSRVEQKNIETFHVFHIKIVDNDPSKATLASFSFSSYKFPELADHWSKYINHKVYKVPIGGMVLSDMHFMSIDVV